VTRLVDDDMHPERNGRDLRFTPALVEA
jgi:hypothetical protein